MRAHSWFPALIIVLVVTCAAVGDTPGKRLSKSDDVLTSAEILKRKPVLIYYANDRCFGPDAKQATDAHAQFIGLLKSISGAKGTPEGLKEFTTTLEKSLEQDVVDFNRAVDEETAQLRDLFCTGKAPLAAGLVIVRNAGGMSRASTRYASTPRTLLRYEYCLPAREKVPPTLAVRYLERVWDWDFLNENQEVLLTKPLSNSEMFNWFLEDVGKLFPPTEYRFAFFGKSRGSRAYYFEPPMSTAFTKLDDVEKANLIFKLRAAVSEIPEGAVSPRTISAAVHNVLEEVGPPLKENDSANEYVSKGVFFRWFLDHAGPDNLKNMHFSQVVLDVNYAPVELTPVKDTHFLLGEPPQYANMRIDNADYLHFSEWVPNYLHFELGKLFPAFRPTGPDFMEHFKKHIEAAK